MTMGIAAQLKKAIIFIHRWMGVAFCLLFLTWFSSGIVMMYWDYPEVSAADRLTRAPALDPLKIRFLPQQAYARLLTSRRPTRVSLETLNGRPAYMFRFGRADRMVYADDGLEQSNFPSDITLQIASAWTQQPPNAVTVEENTEEDQWTVSGQFRALRPMRKYTWPDGEQVYVSTITGSVVQYTTRASRIGAYFGAIPHWLYFTPLRKHPQQWGQVVIWMSGLGAILAIIGIVIGVWIYSPSKPYRYKGAPSSLPYAGQKRWHSILGLIFGVFACTWTFSGMLSMDPFPQLQAGNSDETEATLAEALRGPLPQMAAFSARSPQDVLAQLTPDFQTKEIELASFAGEPFYLAIGAQNQTRIVLVHGDSKTAAEFPHDKVIDVLRQAAQPAAITEVRLVTEYESYYLDRRHRLPLPAIFIRLNDAEHSSYYVDPKTARIVQSYNLHSRWNRWLYHGLHSMDLPWLYKHRPAWDIMVLALMLGGASLCITSLILAWRVLRRKLARRAGFGKRVPNNRAISRNLRTKKPWTARTNTKKG